MTLAYNCLTSFLNSFESTALFLVCTEYTPATFRSTFDWLSLKLFFFWNSQLRDKLGSNPARLLFWQKDIVH